MVHTGWRAPLVVARTSPSPFSSMDFYEREELEHKVLDAQCQLCTGHGSKPRELDSNPSQRARWLALHTRERGRT